MTHALRTDAVQTLALTPQLQESIRLLQLSSLDLQQELETMLDRNPFLEVEENPSSASEGEVPAAQTTAELVPVDGDARSAPDETDIAWGSSRYTSSPALDGESEEPELRVQRPTSLREHLREQAAVMQLPFRDRAILTALIDAVDERGYLEQPLHEIAAQFTAIDHVELDELKIALRLLQSMEPAGVGARTLAECLELQLRNRAEGEPGLELARRIVRDHLTLFATHDLQKLMQTLECDAAALREANAVIQHLDPRPGTQFSTTPTQYVVADAIVTRGKNGWIARINPDAVPRVRINRLYAGLARRARTDASTQLAAELQNARWFIRNIRQRFLTIQRVAQAIVDRQSLFFEHGPIAMRPLMLRDIARAIDVHESTVSRATSNKFMATPRGLLEFRHFFGSSVETASGNFTSSTAIRTLIREIIAAEPRQKPLSDIQITKALTARGLRVARRTVTKYRDAMHIPPVDARRLAAR